MNVLSLFSGIGGLDLGLERAGMTICGQVEIDPWCRRVLAKHWPEVPRHDDVRTCAAWWQALADTPLSGRHDSRDHRLGETASIDAGQALAGEPRGSRGPERRQSATADSGRPAVDLVCGGFPCQPVSLAGKRLAQADSRWLWPATRDVIRQLRPRWVLLENVPGLLGRGMGDVLGDLAACGYDAEWDCVPACFIGAPHIRDRVWIVAYPQRDTRQPCGPSDASEGTRRRHARGGAVSANHMAYAQDGDGVDVPGIRGALERRPRRRIPGDSSMAPRVFRTVPARRDWPAEPCIRRVAHGIPRRVDRLRGLGNAVVPQVAEHIGRLIMQAAA